MKAVVIAVVVAIGGIMPYLTKTSPVPTPVVITDNSVTGDARIIDGDTVIVAGVTIRLKGVDAAEIGTWLGDAARRRMVRIIGNSPLTCTLTEERSRGRRVGYCFTVKGTDIARAIIEQGYALACARYDDRYVQYEQLSLVAIQARSSYCVERRKDAI